MRHVTLNVAPGATYAAWTFGGRVPGPALHVGQGDTVDFTVVNHANIPHSMDFHAAELAPSKYYVNVMPGDSLHYRFVARVPGAFLYHCGTAPVAMHIANGMYGALIVDPATPEPKAKEFFLVQSEFYFAPKPGADGAHTLDGGKLLGLAPDHVVFNGRASQYAEHPLEVAQLLSGRDHRDEVVAAAILHDVVEDTGVEPAEIAERFGPEVAALVEVLSEPSPVGSYRERKARLRDAVSRASDEALVIFAADKVAKVRELRMTIAMGGAADPEKLEHYWASLEMLTAQHAGHPLVQQLRFELEALELLPPHAA